MLGIRSSRAAMAALSLPAAVSALLLTPRAGRAEQFVLFDVTFTFTKMDADNSTPSKSHYYVKGAAINPKRPRDWTSPVDYRNGTVHIRTEVLDRPASGEPTQWSLCYIPNRGQGNGYGCTGTDPYKEKGVYEKDVSMKSFWENDAIIWTRRHQADGSGDEGQGRQQSPHARRSREVLPDPCSHHHDPGFRGRKVRSQSRAQHPPCQTRRQAQGGRGFHIRGEIRIIWPGLSPRYAPSRGCLLRRLPPFGHYP